MLHNKKISLIIPCKDEAAALYTLLKKVPAFIDEVIVVDNNSRDNTAAVAKEAGAKVYTDKRTQDGVGYGYAHQTGLRHATGDIIVAMDGDGTYPIEKISEVISYMEKSEADFVSCARFPLEDRRAISLTRQAGVKLLNIQVSLLYGYRIKDILSGMWVMKRECAKKIKARSGDWNFSPEIKLAALSHPNIHFSEYHIPHAVRFNGMSKQQIWKTGFNHMSYIVKRRYTVDRVRAKHQAQFFADQMRYALKTLLALAFLKSHVS